MSGFQLKIIGLLFMTLDHIYQYFKFIGIPVYFNWIGRLVAPLFIFISVEGYNHTSSIKRYMRRLYIGSVFMNMGNIIIPSIISRADGMSIPNNIFEGIFLTILYIHIFESVKDGLKTENRRKIVISSIAGLIPIFSGMVLLNMNSIGGVGPLGLVLDIFIPDIFTSEGGIVLVLIGFVMHISRENRLKMASRYAVLSLLTIDYSHISVRSLFFENYQWMMIFSALFMLIYNGKKGRGMKYLFYLYYPLHIYIFYVLSSLIMIQL